MYVQLVDDKDKISTCYLKVAECNSRARAIPTEFLLRKRQMAEFWLEIMEKGIFYRPARLLSVKIINQLVAEDDIKGSVKVLADEMDPLKKEIIDLEAIEGGCREFCSSVGNYRVSESLRKLCAASL
jgi:hypothetical protein